MQEIFTNQSTFGRGIRGNSFKNIKSGSTYARPLELEHKVDDMKT